MSAAILMPVWAIAQLLGQGCIIKESSFPVKKKMGRCIAHYGQRGLKLPKNLKMLVRWRW